MLEVASVEGITGDVGMEQAIVVITDYESELKDKEGQEIDLGSSLEPPLKRRKSKSEEREFKCGFCAKSFSMRIALEKHLVVHGAKLPWDCAECGKGFMKSSDYKEHCNKAHGNYRPFPCPTCGKMLSNLGILKNHQGLHSGERPFQCSYTDCEKAFLTKTNLEDHERKHANAREFECETCHKRFNLKGDLRQHEKVHKQDKPFQCEFCDMTFPRGPSLWRHRRTHTGEKPYACDICGKTFARMENCQEHRRIHTGERPLVCKVCGKAFRDSGNFSNHKKIHQDGYVPRKKRATRESVGAPEEVASQEVAFIVAPMGAIEQASSEATEAATSTTESSYVQVGNVLLSFEMEAAFKQLMQQHTGNSEYVTLAMTDGKGLELVSDPSQFEQSLPTESAISSESAAETATALADIKTTEEQTSKAQASTQEIVQAIIAAVKPSDKGVAGDSETQENTQKATADVEIPKIVLTAGTSITTNTISTQGALATDGTPEIKPCADPETGSIAAESAESSSQNAVKPEPMDKVADKADKTEDPKTVNAE
eukprot:Seg798.5 transcript_id=Seg798.5/GoldUCD/mRNA.D3Y31 product="Zinc finger protein 324A" protein_id=Seg798.5/GoldUCD/D3Y31